MLHSAQAAPWADRPRAYAVQQTAESRLRSSTYLELHNLRCRCRDGVLVLTGCVSRYYLWQVAHSLVQRLDGVDAIDNQIVVVEGSPSRNS